MQDRILEIQKSKSNFWIHCQKLKDLGYNPSEQYPIGKESIED